MLLVGVGGITGEAVHPLIDGVPAGEVDGKTVMIVAAVGILVNGVTALLFARGRKGDLNVKCAFLHMAADAAVSAGVVVSGSADHGLILWRASRFRRDSLNLALDKVPEGMNAGKVLAYLAALPGVTEVARPPHLLSTTETALTAHLVRPHATLQIEDGDPARACQLAPANVV